MNWDDLRIVSTVSKTNSYSKPARLLHMDETTVSRRIARLESSFGVTLFEAVDGRRNPTGPCRAILQQLYDVEQTADDIERMLQRHDYSRRRLRLTTIPAIAEHYLAPHLPALLKERPELSLSLDTSDQSVDMSRWEADFAIRLSRPRQGDFLMRRIGEMKLCLIRGRDPDPVLVAYPPVLSATPEMRQLQQVQGDNPIRLETMNLSIICSVVASGQATGVIPEFLAQTLDPNAPVDITPLPESREIWMLSQPHLRNDSLARHISDWCADLLG